MFGRSAEPQKGIMLLQFTTPERVVHHAIEILKTPKADLSDALNTLPLPVYATDEKGLITHFNSAAVSLAGRVPTPLEDRWCVTWKMYTLDGSYVPHEESPMAVSIRKEHPVRGAEGVAERPDGTQLKIRPYPTPFYDDSGNLAGAVNVLVDVNAQRQISYFRDLAGRCRRLARAVLDDPSAGTFEELAEEYEALALELSSQIESGVSQHLD